MKRLTVFYDADCGLCVACGAWASHQPAFVPLEFLPAHSPEAVRRFPELEAAEFRDELVAVSDAGEVWHGARAWIVVLWALQEYREWALFLAAPHLLPLARTFFALVSSQRKRFSHWFGFDIEEKVVEELKSHRIPHCVAAEASIPMATVAPAAPFVPRYVPPAMKRSFREH